MPNFTRSGLPNVSQSKQCRFFCGQIIAACSLITQMHLSLEYVATNGIHDNHMQFIVGYILLSVLSECWFRTLVRRKHFSPKLGCVKQALHGFHEVEMFKMRSKNYWNLWKTNKFALSNQHVYNKCLQHLATSNYTISPIWNMQMMQPCLQQIRTTSRQH